jgi:predicted NBD/HSP70 family sugar kinase
MARDLRDAPKRHDVDVGARHAGHLRPLNLDRVLAFAIGRPGPFTRAEVIAATGLSAPTVGTLCALLIERGVVTDLGTGPSRGGRRPSSMAFNTRHRFVAGIDIGPTMTRLAVGDLRGEVVSMRVVETPSDCRPAELLSQIAGALRKLLKDSAAPLDRVLTVAAGAPGVVDRDRGVVVAFAPNLAGWSDVPMAMLLRRSLGVPVVVENDVNLAVLGEHWRGAARGHETCAFMTVGTGIGAGVMVNGTLYHGRRFMAGEIALMCMGPQYIETEFGARGCLETLAGLKAIASRWSDSAGTQANSWVRDLFEAAKSGDSRARTIVDETATLIGMAAANLSVVLDPSLIVLGGALFAQAPELVEDVRRVVARIVPAPTAVVLSQLDKEAPLWGSLLVATMEAHERLRQQLRAEIVED